MSATKVKHIALSAALVAAILSAHSLRAGQLLIETHRAAGVNCGQCHQEKPPALKPPPDVCLACHGDQATLAKKSENASPNPHAPPHAPSGETQICTECHHVHRPSEVSCSNCHRDFFFNVK